MANTQAHNLAPEQLDQHDLAVDYHLGQLTATDKVAFEAQLDQDQSLRNITTSAEAMLTRLHHLSTPTKAPEHIWLSLQSAIQAEKAGKTATTTSAPFRESAQSQDNTSNKSNSWLTWLAGGSSVLAALLLAILLVPGIFTGLSNTTATMPYTAVMHDANAEPMWLVKANTSMSTLEINNTLPLKIPYGHDSNVCLLWIETTDGSVAITKVPVDGTTTTVDIPPEFQQLLNQGGKLFITREYMRNGHDMPKNPSNHMESVGKFLPKAVI